MLKNEKFELGLLVLISLFLGFYLFFRTYVISFDGAFQYVPIAKDFASGFFRKALSHNQQPLYSLIVAFVSRWVPDFELAGKLVSSILGILLVIPVYFLGKRIFDEKIGMKRNGYFFSSWMVFQAYQMAVPKKNRNVDSFRTSAENLRI